MSDLIEKGQLEEVKWRSPSICLIQNLTLEPVLVNPVLRQLSVLQMDASDTMQEALTIKCAVEELHHHQDRTSHHPG